MDFELAARKLGCSVEAIQAVAFVESSGGGFLPNGQPKVCFERHIFRKRLLSNGVSKQDVEDLQDLYPDLICTTPGGYRGGHAEHERLGRAVDIHRDSALESCSWGAFQIMGHHWTTLGYKRLQEFINDAFKSEQSQLNMFVRFILADSRLLNALKKKDWKTFAMIYNGPAYAKNKYDQKIKDAFEKFSKENKL